MSLLAEPPRTPRLSRAGLGFVLALHALVFWLLLRANVITLPEQLAVLTVSLIRPAEETKPQPDVTPPRPMPVKPRPAPPRPPVQLAAPETSPAPLPAVVPPAPPAHFRNTQPASPHAGEPARFDMDDSTSMRTWPRTPSITPSRRD